MRAIVLDAFGGADRLQISEVPRPVAAAGQLLIKVAYAGVNPADWKDREGFTARFFDIDFPYIIGFDAAGTVVETGAGVAGFSVGDRVFTTTDHGQGAQGSYAEFVVASQQRVALVPDGLELKSAAVVPVAGLTAWQALFDPEKGAVQSGQQVVIHGASGGVGSFAIQFARWAGARVCTTCSGRNLDYVASLGAELPLDYGSGSFISSIRQWAPEGVDLVIDAVGGDTPPSPYEWVKAGGRVVNIMTLVDDDHLPGAINDAASKDITSVVAVMSDERAGEELARIARLLIDRQVTIPPIECFDLAEARIAHQKIQSGHVRGKLVLRVT